MINININIALIHQFVKCFTLSCTYSYTYRL